MRRRSPVRAHPRGAAVAQQALSAHIVDRILVRREAVFNECVRPPLAALHAHILEVAEVLGPHRSAEDLLTGTDAQRAAWLQLPALAARYHKLRGAVVSLDHGFGHWQIHYSLSSGMPAPKSDVDVLNMTVPNPIEDGPLIVTEPASNDVEVPSSDQHVDVAAAARGAAAVNAYVSEVRRSRSADDDSVRA